MVYGQDCEALESDRPDVEILAMPFLRGDLLLFICSVPQFPYQFMVSWLLLYH